ncbi:META domain-containing protein [Agitococcus lubricus]|uniref:Heat shock protein HslJ n=1 Tax=Agitococcus lubricus TaxID=1077255 RepID=A0A2T5IYF4_9GAMM|nr:META domain-containing protein [Agitococcus lubricus]PTQ89021.1 heat shock protein HslJ [Agitococcus lubricus]
MKKASIALIVMACIGACSSQPQRTISLPKVTDKAMVKDRTIALAGNQVSVYGDMPDNFDNTYWQFIHVQGQRLATGDLAAVLRIKTGDLYGTSGCNDYTARYRRDGLWLAVSALKMGNQPCDSLVSQDQLVYKALSQVRSVRLLQSNDNLVLLDAKGSVIAELKALKLPTS